ncbi:MAG: VWA domain-containing protein [Treponema sp.]|nr:VWA domain-containing protein [Treponema sp.]
MTQETYGPPPLAPGEPHLACVLLLDTSGSMSGSPIASLNQALQRFKEQVSMDEMAQKRVDIAIIEFNDTARLIQDFTPIRNMQPITLQATGSTSMGAGINMAIDMVKGRNRYYNSIGTPVFKPWIFMITDGGPTDSIDEAARRIQEEESKGTHGKLKFFALGVEGYSKDALFRLTNRVMELRDKDFSSIFDWMGKSMVAISVSRVGEEAPLPLLPENAKKADPNRDVSTW